MRESTRSSNKKKSPRTFFINCDAASVPTRNWLNFRNTHILPLRRKSSQTLIRTDPRETNTHRVHPHRIIVTRRPDPAKETNREESRPRSARVPRINGRARPTNSPLIIFPAARALSRRSAGLCHVRRPRANIQADARPRKSSYFPESALCPVNSTAPTAAPGSLIYARAPPFFPLSARGGF